VLIDHKWIFTLYSILFVLTYLFSSLCPSLSQQDQSVMASVETDVLGESRLLVLPSVVSTINLLLPGLFHLVARVERYDSPLVATYVSIVR